MAYHESAFSSPQVALLIGVAVSLDVIALTFCSSRIYSADRKTWLRWAKYNAAWHAGLLLTYLMVIDMLSVLVQYIGFFIAVPLPQFLSFLIEPWQWFGRIFRSHIVVYAAIAAMAFVWRQYCHKVTTVPNAAQVADAPFFVRPMFRRFEINAMNPDSRWSWNLSACLVAVDMLALAAVIKSGEKLVQFPDGFDRLEGSLAALNAKILGSIDYEFLGATALITVAVFAIVFFLCAASAFISKIFWANVDNPDATGESGIRATFIVMLLKLLEPLVIFYFIIHSMAFLATGVPIHSPAFLLGSGFLLAALIQYVGLGNIIAAEQAQVNESWVGEKL